MCRLAPRYCGGLVVAGLSFPSLIRGFEVEVENAYGRGESRID